MRDRLNSEICSVYLRALADPDRLRIIQALAEGPQPVGEISRRLRVPMANFSHHLKHLRNAGLVSTRKKGRFVYYAVSKKVLDRNAKLPLNVLDFGCCRVELGSK